MSKAKSKVPEISLSNLRVMPKKYESPEVMKRS